LMQHWQKSNTINLTQNNSFTHFAADSFSSISREVFLKEDISTNI